MNLLFSNSFFFTVAVWLYGAGSGFQEFVFVAEKDEVRRYCCGGTLVRSSASLVQRVSNRGEVCCGEDGKRSCDLLCHRGCCAFVLRIANEVLLRWLTVARDCWPFMVF
ncbi:hypothetical protein DEO72_LG6g2260 [Vigna unguiculata]|uniref:Secreted protein n=1 Tax=Vigna unguiculata TaxID=3917 RepID=A0A4D6M9Y1_VIGUN|nr:hypothetical protein DEO72_LG6g2260 [Vigna unguiculata]